MRMSSECRAPADASRQISHCAACTTVMTANVAVYGPRDAPNSKAHGANMGPIWGRHDPGGPHVGPMNFAFMGGPLNQVVRTLSAMHHNILRLSYG